MTAKRRTRTAGCAVSLLLVTCGHGPDDTAGPQPSDGGPQPSDGAPSPAGAPTATPPESGQPAVVVSFKLDPQVHGGTYGGEIWIAASVYVGIPGQDTVEARASFVDATGRSNPISASWTPSHPEMVTVSPDRGSLVTITVHSAGESELLVTWEGTSKALLVTATAVDGALMQVQIVQ